uniref:K+ efflux antiporter family protein n=1 Tax=Rhizophora mucronata TaxID=61149 RepID=A0A2P2M714_RHIMU
MFTCDDKLIISLRNQGTQVWDNIDKTAKKAINIINSLVMDSTPCRTPEAPPRTGSKANSKPTAQSCKIRVPMVTCP